MAIVEGQKVRVKWNGRNKDWYIDKGYTFTDFREDFEVNYFDLKKGSNMEVDISCDTCSKIKQLKYCYANTKQHHFCDHICEKNFKKNHRQYLIDEFNRFFNEHNRYPNEQEMKVVNGFPSYYQYVQEFDSWSNFLNIIGVKEKDEKWLVHDIEILRDKYSCAPREEIIESLINNYSWGHICNKARELGLNRNSSLFRHNKNWYTKEECINAFWAYHKEFKVYPDSADYNKSTKCPSLSPITKYWGNWNNFIRDLGILGSNGWFVCDEQILIDHYENKELEPQDIIDKLMIKRSWSSIKSKAAKLNLSRPHGVKSKHSNEDLLQLLKEYHKKYHKVPTYSSFMEAEGFLHPKVFTKRFGSWNNALQLAGMELNLINDYSKEKMIADAKCFFKENGRSPYYNELTYSSSLIRKFWKSWDDFLKDSHLPVNKEEHSLKNKEDGIKLLQDIFNESNAIPTTFDIDKYGVRKGWYAYHFGSFRNALYEAGLINDSYKLEQKDTIRNSILALKELAKKLERMPSVMEFEEYLSSLETGYYLSRKNLCDALKISFVQLCEKELSNYTNTFGKIGHYYLNLNGEICKSKAEMQVSNFFISNNLKYEREVLYKRLHPAMKKKYRCDWVIMHNNEKYIIEYFGLYKNETKVTDIVRDYVIKTKEKIRFCDDNDLKLIDLYPQDIENNLEGVKKKISSLLIS